MKRRVLILIVLCLVATVVSGYFLFKGEEKAPGSQQASTKAAIKNKITAEDTPDFNKQQYSLTDPTSSWVIANKQRPLQPKTYAPDDLVIPDMRLRSNITSDERQVRQVTAEALEKLSAAAKQDGITLTLESGYRSYNFQVSLYNRYVSQQGRAVADSQSARPGHSEHQTGLAADVGGITQPSCNVEACYADTIEGKWVAANAYKYGFVIRYPEDNASITGYIYEPWHLRYVGTDLASEMHTKGIQTLEEFFNLPAAPDYN